MLRVDHYHDHHYGAVYYRARVDLSCGDFFTVITPRNDKLPFTVIFQTLGDEIDLQLTPQEAPGHEGHPPEIQGKGETLET